MVVAPILRSCSRDRRWRSGRTGRELLANSVSRAVARRRPNVERAVARRAFMFHPNDFSLLSTRATCEHMHDAALFFYGATPTPALATTYPKVVHTYSMSITRRGTQRAPVRSIREPRSSIDSSLSAREWRIARRYGAWGCHSHGRSSLQTAAAHQGTSCFAGTRAYRIRCDGLGLRRPPSPSERHRAL